jgi:hypothetical protein
VLCFFVSFKRGGVCEHDGDGHEDNEIGRVIE